MISSARAPPGRRPSSRPGAGPAPSDRADVSARPRSRGGGCRARRAAAAGAVLDGQGLAGQSRDRPAAGVPGRAAGGRGDPGPPGGRGRPPGPDPRRLLPASVRRAGPAGTKRRLWTGTRRPADGREDSASWLSRLHDPGAGGTARGTEREFARRGREVPFPTRILVRELALDEGAAMLGPSLSPLTAAQQKPTQDPRRGPAGVILEKLGRSTRPDAHAALRELHAGWTPPREDQIARALADHPSEDDLPILVAALRRGIRTPRTWGRPPRSSSRPTRAAPRG